ncbi:hypothetical protein ACIPY2_20550 [Paenarthrobacter sp. NPDC089675]|uniref:hypothetical protein n=1 Tax=Paenarthrobacter TaxID=1742992 RepID=UPI003824A67E
MKARLAVSTKRKAHADALADWTELRPGDPVEIVKNAQTISHGTTEEVSGSGAVLWVSPDQPGPSRSYAKSEGILVHRA